MTSGSKAFLEKDITKVSDAEWAQADGAAARAARSRLPADLFTAKSTSIAVPLLVQVLENLSISESAYSQIERLTLTLESSTDRRQSRRIIDLPTQTDGPGPETRTKTTNKLTVEDAGGTRCYCIDLDGCARFAGVGSKLLVRRSPVQRGVLLLSRSDVEFLGGRIPEVDASQQAHLARLKMVLDKRREPVQTEGT